jgi:hypothetical protein
VQVVVSASGFPPASKKDVDEVLLALFVAEEIIAVLAQRVLSRLTTADVERSTASSAVSVIVGLAITLYFGAPREHPGATAALGFGILLWFFVGLPQPDAPFGMVVGGSMGMMDWPQGITQWLALLGLLCFWFARSAQRRHERGLRRPSASTT